LAREHAGTLIVCHSVDWLPLIAELESAGAIADPNLTIERLMEYGATLVSAAANIARRFGVDAEHRIVDGEAADAILAVADDTQSQLIVMGTHGRNGIGRLVTGSTTEAVLRGSSIPVLTVRPDTTIAEETRRSFEHILVGVDASEPADAALNVVLELPALDRRAIVVCNVVDLGASGDRLLEAQRIVDDATASARSRKIHAIGRTTVGNAETALNSVAQADHADLIVIGSHGRRGVRRFLLGSVAESVVRTASLPVLVVRTAPRARPRFADSMASAQQR